MKEHKVDVAIIGAGSAGLYALSEIRKSGRHFILINGGTLGTTCARIGCMPSKTLIQVANDYHRHGVFKHYGVQGHDDIIPDIPAALKYVRQMRDTFVTQVCAKTTDRMGKALIPGKARFLQPDLLDVEGTRIRARKIIIATGSRPLVPAAWAAFGDQILTTDTLFEQDNLPSAMAVIGLGAIGLELGQALHRLGIQVSGFDQLDRIGGLTDPKVNKAALEILGKEFSIHLGQTAKITEESGKLRVTAGKESIVVDKVLASLGRIPNLDGLSLENIGIELNDRGIPIHDPNTMQIGELPIFIAGDANGERPLLHEAGDEGRIAGYNVVHKNIKAFSRKVPLGITFCDPNICMVGKHWAKLEHENIAIGESAFDTEPRAMVMARNQGLLRLFADKATGTLLGAEIIAPAGEHLAHLLAWSIQQRLSVDKMLCMPFYHPVIEEGLQSALYDLHTKLDGNKPDDITGLKTLGTSSR